MTAEAVVAYLGIVLAGCVAVCIADSFSAAEIALRLRVAGAKAVVTQASWLGGRRRQLPLHACGTRMCDADGITCSTGG